MPNVIGHARDHVRGMWVLQQGQLMIMFWHRNFQIRSRFVELAFQQIDVKLQWEGTGVDGGVCTRTNKTIVRVDPRYFRPTEVDSLQGCIKAFRDFGWQATIGLADMVAEMVQHDLAELRSASQKT